MAFECAFPDKEAIAICNINLTLSQQNGEFNNYLMRRTYRKLLSILHVIIYS